MDVSWSDLVTDAHNLGHNEALGALRFLAAANDETRQELDDLLDAYDDGTAVERAKISQQIRELIGRA